MKKRYKMHPGEYALGENEKMYEDMAARGWKLVKRGSLLSKFEKAEPEKLRYRIELSSPPVFEETQELPEEQLELYEECGWQLVTRSGFMYVFMTPAGSEAPEFYSDPRQQAATLKGLKRSYWLSWIPSILVLGLSLIMAVSVAGNPESALRKWFFSLQLDWFRHTALCIFCSGLILWGMYASVYGAVSTMRLYHRLKKGIPLDHSPHHKRLPHKVMNGLFLVGCLLSAVMSILQWIETSEYEMPEKADGPYLLLRDLGVEGVRSQSSVKNQSSTVQKSQSLLCTMWFTYECMEERSQEYWMYQDIYEMKTQKEAQNMTRILMENALFAKDPSEFTQVNLDGMDLAYESELEFVAVKGTRVYFITYLGKEQVLAALAKK